MLYMKSSDGELTIVVLESANLEEMKKGRPCVSPDRSVLIAWTPDPVWLADRIMDSQGDAGMIAAAIDEASRRPQQPPRKYHDPFFTNLKPPGGT